MTSQEIDLLKKGAATYGISLDEGALGRFRRFASLLDSWSHKTNLISKNDLGRLVTHHFLDSLKIASRVSMAQRARILDFGSGAGFPGIPLAIAFPAASVYLVESRPKRSAFLEAAVKELGLTNALVMGSRIESVSGDFEGSFDLVATRATVALHAFFSLAARFLSPGGMLAAIKGEHIDEEFSLLESTVDAGVFNILRTRPEAFPGVRDGWVVVVQRPELSTVDGNV